MYKIWITFIATLGIALLSLFCVNKLYKNGMVAGENKIKLENIITINKESQSAIDEVMNMDLNELYRIKQNEDVKIPPITSCFVDAEWLRKLESLK